MSADPLEIRSWPVFVRLCFWFFATLGFPVVVSLVIGRLGLQLAWPWGWVNLAVASFLASWFVVDVLFPRRTIYGFFGALEGTLKHGLRFWRRVALLTTSVLSLAGALVALTAGDSSEVPIPPQTAPLLVVLAGAFLASFGWMYTRFEQEKADRASATLQAIRDQMYDSKIASIYRMLTVFSRYCVETMGTPADRPFDEKELAVRLETVLVGIKARSLESYSHSEAADQFINALNQLAFGVRQGQFDFDTIKLVLRPRFVRMAFRYHELIAQSTNAEYVAALDRDRACGRTWEHFLWLVSKMEVLSSDAVSYRYIMMPPSHIVGTREGERVKAPRSFLQKEC